MYWLGQDLVFPDHSEVNDEGIIAIGGDLSVELSIEELEEMVLKYEGAMVPAHINKSSNSLIVNLGFIPSELRISCIEVHEKSPINEKLLGNYKRLYNSDAHYLENIQEPIHMVEIKEKTSQAVIDFLTGKD